MNLRDVDVAGERRKEGPPSPALFLPPPSHRVTHSPTSLFFSFPPSSGPAPLGRTAEGEKGGGKERRTTFLHVLGGGGGRGGGGRRKELGFAFLPSSPPPSSGFTGFPEILLHFSCYTRYRSTFFVSFSFVPPFLRIMKKKHRRAGRKAYLTCRKKSKMNLPTCNKAPTSLSLLRLKACASTQVLDKLAGRRRSEVSSPSS